MKSGSWLPSSLLCVVACASTPPRSPEPAVAAVAPRPAEPAPRAAIEASDAPEAPPPERVTEAPSRAAPTIEDWLRASTSCTNLAVEGADLSPLPDGAAFEITAEQRRAMAKGARDARIAMYEEREGAIERQALDGWIDEGAPMTILQAVRTGDARWKAELERIVVFAFEHPRYGASVSVVGFSSRTKSWFEIIGGADSRTRALALADRNDDGWTDVLLVRPTRSRALDYWWATTRPGDERRWTTTPSGGSIQVGRRNWLLSGLGITCPSEAPAM